MMNKVKYKKSLCVFCGSKYGNSLIYKKAAKELGIYLAKNKIRLVYGGGSLGLMGELSDSVNRNNGDVLGVIPKHLLQIEGINKNLIDVLVSDHKPEDEESKRLTFAQAATGASGIETLLSLSLELYHNGSLKLETIIKAMTSNPAKILKINKGNLSIGNDADFCIVDLDKPWIVKKEKLISKSKNTSIEDKKLQGKVTNTFVKGKELFKL